MKAIHKKVLKAFEKAFKCYAGRLHLMRGGHKGYAPVFEQVTEFPDRMKGMAKTADLTGSARPGKSWLDGLPRLIFVSDMGDALSDGVGHMFLKEQIIENARSNGGSRHLWLWLTKRPQKMAIFSEWLIDHGMTWPENLVAMTSVTSRATCKRIDQLRKVKAPLKGLSVEPLWENITPDLGEIDWCIVGGESGASAKPFDLAWARDLHLRCHKPRTAFFVKQLGKLPFENGKKLELCDSHGGDWNEWPQDLKIRSFPQAFYKIGSASPTGITT